MPFLGSTYAKIALHWSLQHCPRPPNWKRKDGNWGITEKATKKGEGWVHEGKKKEAEGTKKKAGRQEWGKCVLIFPKFLNSTLYILVLVCLSVLGSAMRMSFIRAMKLLLRLKSWCPVGPLVCVKRLLSPVVGVFMHHESNHTVMWIHQ